MDNKYTIVIYIAIVAFAVLASVIKKIRKANNPNNQQYKKPVNTQQKQTYNKPQSTQPKSLEDILQSLLNEQKPVTKPTQQTYKAPVTNDKPLVKSTTLEDTTSLEKIEEEKYYGFDTELSYDKELEDYDKMEDHHVHGAGFDQNMEEEAVKEDNEWANIDWRKAVITAEILRRPEY